MRCGCRCTCSDVYAFTWGGDPGGLRASDGASRMPTQLLGPRGRWECRSTCSCFWECGGAPPPPKLLCGPAPVLCAHHGSRKGTCAHAQLCALELLPHTRVCTLAHPGLHACSMTALERLDHELARTLCAALCVLQLSA